jgi:hypothetical protein
MDKVIVLESNEYSRTYQLGDVKLYIAKAFDDVQNKHYIVCSIPEIPELNVLKIQYPMEFQLEADRDSVFETFDAEDFIQAVKNQIVKNNEQYVNGQN